MWEMKLRRTETTDKPRLLVVSNHFDMIYECHEQIRSSVRVRVKKHLMCVSPDFELHAKCYFTEDVREVESRSF